MLTDGFPVAGLPAPGLAVWKGDRVSASIAAASVVAKVTRDRIMVGLHDAAGRHYDFADHKGYVTPVHNAALDAARAVPGAPVLLHQRGPPGARRRPGARRGPWCAIGEDDTDRRCRRCC